MKDSSEKEAEIVKFPGIASVSLSITPINELDNIDLVETIIRVYDENNEQIMRQKARGILTIAKNLKLFIQSRSNFPINDRRMAVWFADYLNKQKIKIDEEKAYQIIKNATQLLEKISRITIEHVDPSDLIPIESDVLAKIIELTSEHLLSEDELFSILEKNQTPLSNKVNRTIYFKNDGGVDHKDSINLEILSTEKMLGYKLIASFKNETEHELKNIIISDIIPYAYKIVEMNSNDGGKFTKELLEQGLKLTWRISKLASGDEIKVNYNLEKRILRTIMIRKGEEIRIVQDYTSLLKDEDEEGKIIYYFNSELLSLLPVTLDEIIIRDLIPPELRIADKYKTEEMSFIDFGQKFGINIQQILSDVKAGTKFFQKYIVEFAPSLWKLDFSVTIDEELQESILVSKIIEATPIANTLICTIVVTTNVPCTIINEIEMGLNATEFLPMHLKPQDVKKPHWNVEDVLIVSMVLTGNLTRQPNPIKVVAKGKEYSSKSTTITQIRKNQLLTVPFNHVALYRRTLR